MAVLVMLGNVVVTCVRGWMTLKLSPCVSIYHGLVSALRAQRAGGYGAEIKRLHGAGNPPSPILSPPVLAHSHAADFRIFFSELLNGRPIPQLTGSFSLLSYLLGNNIYLDVCCKSRLSPGLNAAGLSKGQNALLGGMKWPGWMESTADLKLYENLGFCGIV